MRNRVSAFVVLITPIPFCLMENFRVVFDDPGEYTYHCEIHPELNGLVIVQE